MSDKVYVPYMTNQEAAEILLRYFPAVPNAKVRYAAAMGVEALKKQVGIERALERLEELAETYLGDANCAVYESIEIIKEEVDIK